MTALRNTSNQATALQILTLDTGKLNSCPTCGICSPILGAKACRETLVNSSVSWLEIRLIFLSYACKLKLPSTAIGTSYPRSGESACTNSGYASSLHMTIRSSKMLCSIENNILQPNTKVSYGLKHKEALKSYMHSLSAIRRTRALKP